MPGGSKSLYFAIDLGHTHCVRLLLEAGANANKGYGHESLVHLQLEGPRRLP